VTHDDCAWHPATQAAARAASREPRGAWRVVFFVCVRVVLVGWRLPPSIVLIMIGEHNWSALLDEDTETHDDAD